MKKVTRQILLLGSLLLIAAVMTMAAAPSVLAAKTRPTRTPQPTSTSQVTSTTQPTPAPTSTTFPFLITTTSLPDGNVCANYAAFITANKGGGFSLDTWKIVSGQLPAGLTMATSYGIMSTVVTGTPVTLQTAAFTVQVQDNAGDTATKTFSIRIYPPLPLNVTNQGSTLAPGTVGTAYSSNLFTSGGCRPLVWSITAGQLPPGLALTQNSTGQDNNIISGTATAAGTFAFTARVTSDDGQTASRPFSITIN
jgi:Putative Ig domain